MTFKIELLEFLSFRSTLINCIFNKLLYLHSIIRDRQVTLKALQTDNIQ